jgi:hypothetical protein
MIKRTIFYRLKKALIKLIKKICISNNKVKSVFQIKKNQKKDHLAKIKMIKEF